MEILNYGFFLPLALLILAFLWAAVKILREYVSAVPAPPCTAET